MKGRSCPDLTASFGDDFGQFGGIFLSCQMIWTDLACLLSLPTWFLSIFTHKSIWHRAIYDIIQDSQNKSTILIHDAFDAVLPYGYCVGNLYSIVKFSDDFDADWRARMLEIIEGKMPLNQCLPIQEKPRHSWAYLLFRSPVEITIAQTLDKYRVLYLPNCMARLGYPETRENKEADFLVCYDGKWGILEINGDTYHVNSAKDHNRGRLFKLHGIKVFEPYEASRCVKEPNKVVQEFLELVKKNG